MEEKLGKYSLGQVLAGLTLLLAWLVFIISVSLPEYKVSNGRRLRTPLAVCMMMRDEDDLVEWITYHHRMGVDKFYIYGMDAEESLSSHTRRQCFESSKR